MNRTVLSDLNGTPVLSFAERPGITFRITDVIGRGASCVVYHAISSDNTEHLLKEYYPQNLPLIRDVSGQILVPDDKRGAFDAGLMRFRSGCERQNAIRLSNGMKNFTCNVQGYYQANGTEYIDMTCFSGQTYDHVQEKSVYDLMLRMRTLTQVVGNYHKAGLLHLDIKPENIYVRPEEETVEDVMLFDFDSVTPMRDIFTSRGLSCSKSWAAPEQKTVQRQREICPATDLFAIGEIIFVQLFGRPLKEAECRSYVRHYAYDHSAEIFKNMNPKVFLLLDDLFCHTIRGVVKQRYQSAEELIAKIEEIIRLSDPKEPYLKSSTLTMQEFFVGREKEIEEIRQKLSEDRILFLSGIGGIGKSELAKRYAEAHRDEYDTIIFAPYVSDVNMLIQDDTAIPLYNFTPYPEEKPEEYCARKLKKLMELCDERTLFIVDNLDRDDDPDLKKLLDLGAKLLITTRMDFEEYGIGQQLPLDALQDRAEIRKIFDKYYTKPLAAADESCVEQIIDLVAGHTMTVELLAKQMMAGRVKPEKMLEKLQEGGISESGKEKVRSGKDGVLSAQSAYAHIQTLFDLSGLNEDERYILANLSLIPYTGADVEKFSSWCSLEHYNDINTLIVSGWIIHEKLRDYIMMHPVIQEVCFAFWKHKNFLEDFDDCNMCEDDFDDFNLRLLDSGKDVLMGYYEEYILPTSIIKRFFDCHQKFYDLLISDPASYNSKASEYYIREYILLEHAMPFLNVGSESVARKLCEICRLQYGALEVISERKQSSEPDSFRQVRSLQDSIKNMACETISACMVVRLRMECSKVLHPLLSETIYDALSYLYLILEEFDKAEDMMYKSWENRWHEPWKNNLDDMDSKLASRLVELYRYKNEPEKSKFFSALSSKIWAEKEDWGTIY